MADSIFTYIEPLIALTALFFTGVNWLISQRLSNFDKRMDFLDDALKAYQQKTTYELQNLETQLDKIYNLLLSKATK